MKGPDSYLIKSVFLLPSSYHDKRTLQLIKAIEADPAFPPHYCVQKLKVRNKLQHEEDMSISVWMAPAAWLGSRARHNSKRVKDFTSRIPFADAAPEDHVVFTTLPLPAEIPVDKPLEEKEWKGVKGVCVYDAHSHSFLLYRHKLAAPLQQLLTGLCVSLDSHTVLYSPEVMRHRICKALAETKNPDHYQAAALYERLPGVSLEELCNLVVIQARRHEHAPKIRVETVQSSKYPKAEWDWYDNASRIKQLMADLCSLIYGMELLHSLLATLCCAGVDGSLFREVVDELVFQG